MDPIFLILGAAALIIVLVVVWLLVARAGVAATRSRVDRGWGVVTSSLGERGDVAVALAELLRGAGARGSALDEAAHAATNARAIASPADAAQSATQLSGALRSLMALAADSQGVRATADYRALETSIASTEDGVQSGRREYNASLRELHARGRRFPSSLFVGAADRGREFLEVGGATTAEPPRVQF